MAFIIPVVGMHFKLWGVVSADVRNLKKLLLKINQLHLSQVVFNKQKLQLRNNLEYI